MEQKKHSEVEAATVTGLPLVSILTPTYNHRRFIGACIESVLSQSYTRWEQIIVNDGSTDSTRAIVERYKDPRIRYIEQENQGIEALGLTYNRALSCSQGTLVAILEGDDTWPPEKLARLVPAFRDPQVVLAFGEFQDIDADGVIGKNRPRTYRQRGNLPRSILFNDPIGSAIPYLLSASGQTLIATCTVLMRRAALDSIGGFYYLPEKCTPDVPTFARLSRLGRFYYTPELVAYHRRHRDSATVQFLDKLPHANSMFALNAAASPMFNLTGAQRKAIKESWRLIPLRVEFTRGRMCLLQREWARARQHFAGAMRAGDSRILIGAIVGWALSWIHSDLEGVFRLAGRASLRQ